MPDAFHTFRELYLAYGYVALFVGVMLENAGIPVPGETAVLVAGFLSSPSGGAHLNLAVVIGLTVLAAVLGDNIGFWLGHRFARRRLLHGKGFLFLSHETWQHAEGYFRRYGAWTIFFARFITGLRVVASLAAGTAGMSWPRFLLANALGAVIWASAISVLGYFFGRSWHTIHRWLGWGGLILCVGLALALGVAHYLRRFHRFEETNDESSKERKHE